MNLQTLALRHYVHSYAGIELPRVPVRVRNAVMQALDQGYLVARDGDARVIYHALCTAYGVIEGQFGPWYGGNTILRFRGMPLPPGALSQLQKLWMAEAAARKLSHGTTDANPFKNEGPDNRTNYWIYREVTPNLSGVLRAIRNNEQQKTRLAQLLLAIEEQGIVQVHPRIIK